MAQVADRVSRARQEGRATVPVSRNDPQQAGCLTASRRVRGALDKQVEERLKADGCRRGGSFFRPTGCRCPTHTFWSSREDAEAFGGRRAEGALA